MWAQVYFVLSQYTRLTDRRTDRRTERPLRYRALHTCSRAVKPGNVINGTIKLIRSRCESALDSDIIKSFDENRQT